MIGKEELENLILVRKLSYEEIGRRVGLTGAWIKKRARKYGINLPQKRTINPSEWVKFGHRKLSDITIMNDYFNEWLPTGDIKKK